jgi:hypothetical protein
MAAMDLRDCRQPAFAMRTSKDVIHTSSVQAQSRKLDKRSQ